MPVPGAMASLYVQEEFALRFLEPYEMQAELKSLGFDTDLVEVDDNVPLNPKPRS